MVYFFTLSNLVIFYNRC